MKAQFKFLSGARSGQVETFSKAYLGLGRHPLSDVRFDAERDLDVSSRHAAIMAKPEGFVLQDLGSKNGTFVNGEKLTGDRLLVDGDVIGFGAKGPALEFRMLVSPDDRPTETAAAAEAAAGRLSDPRQVVPATVPPPTRRPGAPKPRSTTQIIEMATAPWRRTATILVGMVVLVVALALFVVWKGAQDRKTELARIRVWADSITNEARRAAQQSDSAIKGLRDELQRSLAEIERLQHQIAVAPSDAGTVRALRDQLAQAQARQQLIVGASQVEWRDVSARNQGAVALVLVEFSETERFSGSAFAVDSQGTLVTNKHVLVGENGDRTPRRIAVKFSGTRQWFPGRYVGVSPDADLGVLKVDIRGGTPRVQGLSRDPRSLQRGDPVAIIGYPLGLDLPMEGQGTDVVASPTLTVGTASKVLPGVVQVDGYGAPGSSGSPIFDRDGRVVAVLYGGVQESNGRIILAVPVSFVTEFLSKGR